MSALRPAEPKPGQIVGSDLIALSETVLQHSKLEVKCLSEEDLREAGRRYRALEKVDPSEDEAATKEQLTSLFCCVMSLGSIFVDFAIWIPHWTRLAKKLRFKGMLINALGEYFTAEMFGPGTYEIWETCFTVFRTACLSLGLVSSGRLRQYMLKVKALSRQFPSAWSLVYQADVRMRSKRMPKLKAKLEDDYEEAKANNWRTTFDPKMPWGAVFAEAAENDTNWWARHIKDPGMTTNCGALLVRDCVDGDAGVSDQRRGALSRGLTP